MYPNGECAVYKPRTFKPQPIKRYTRTERTELQMARLRLSLTDISLEGALALLLGLSPLPIFDSDSVEVAGTPEVAGHRVTRQGLNGITSHGTRMVRNAAHLIEREGGRSGAVFATATVPELPLEQMAILHERWHKATEIYRLNLKRMLQKKGLSGESVSVFEIQEKRYKRTGVPVLHIHTVFRGKTRSGQWAITPEDHDRIWVAALNAAIGTNLVDVRAACNLQRVKQSTEGYIGKYMTKGTKVVAELVSKGFTRWIPKHWWACSRPLRARIDAETRCPHELADWLNDSADIEGSEVWLWHRDIVLEMSDGHKITIARYGRLSIRQTAQIHAYCDSA